MMNLRGKFYDFNPPLAKNAPERDSAWEGAKLAVTYHPAYLLRDPRQKKEAWKDLQMVMKELGMKAPAKATE
jgi:uracil-DNA glycosylase family 4